MPNRNETEPKEVGPLTREKLDPYNEDYSRDVSLAEDNIGRGFYRGFGRGFRKVIIQVMKPDIGQNHENRPQIPESRDKKS